jgi:exonuclease SbcC
MYIKQLVLDDFQSHAHTVIDFHPNFNVLVGTGHSGKTSIIRALSCLLYGDWDSSWVRTGAKFCKITLTTSDGNTVVREKGEGVNRYTLKVPGQAEQLYEHFGIEIPQDIQKVLKIFAAQIDRTEFLRLNMATQHEPLFMLSKTGSFKAKVMGKLSGAHYLDYALREINKEKKGLSAEKHVKQIEELDLRKQLIQFEGLDVQQTQLKDLEDRITAVGRKLEFVSQLETLLLATEAWKAAFYSTRDEIDRLNQVSTENITKLTDTTNVLAQLEELDKKLDWYANELTDEQDEYQAIATEHATAVETYKTTLKEAGVCPTCEQDTTNL